MFQQRTNFYEIKINYKRYFCYWLLELKLQSRNLLKILFSFLNRSIVNTQMRALSGIINCNETSNIEKGAIAEIEVYCLRSNAPSVTIGKCQIENLESFPFEFTVNWDDVSLLNKNARCMVGARITRNERLDFLTRIDTSLIDKSSGNVLEKVDILMVNVNRKQ